MSSCGHCDVHILLDASQHVFLAFWPTTVCTWAAERAQTDVKSLHFKLKRMNKRVNVQRCYVMMKYYVPVVYILHAIVRILNGQLPYIPKIKTKSIWFVTQSISLHGHCFINILLALFLLLKVASILANLINVALLKLTESSHDPFYILTVHPVCLQGNALKLALTNPSQMVKR